MSRIWKHLRCVPRPVQAPRTRLSRFASSASPSEPISPGILARARTTATEHTQLTQKVAHDFDAKTAKRLSELSPVTNALRDWEKAQDAVAELLSLLRDASTDAELRELAEADFATAAAQAAQAAQALTAALVPRHPFEDLPCLMEIRPGVGGSEAALFAGDLLRMYQAFCQRRGLRASLLKYEDSTAGLGDPKGVEAPLQEAVLEIETKGAYGILRSEAGVHRVQRVPATESKGRMHTSAASVMILPSFPDAGETDAELDIEDPKSDYYVRPEDVRTDVMRAKGAGGQHVNTTDSAVRLTHLPTNTVVSIQDSRSQHKNRQKAWQLLRARLAQARRETREDEMVKLRRSILGVAKTNRGDKVRTYNWGQQRVTDHRSGMSVHNLDDVMEGGLGLDKIMESVQVWFQEREIDGLMAEDHDSGGSGTDKTHHP